MKFQAQLYLSKRFLKLYFIFYKIWSKERKIYVRLKQQTLIRSISLTHTIISFGLALALEKGSPKELIYLQN